jgi:hypothetical protein
VQTPKTRLVEKEGEQERTNALLKLLAALLAKKATWIMPGNANTSSCNICKLLFQYSQT